MPFDDQVVEFVQTDAERQVLDEFVFGVGRVEGGGEEMDADD